jgi:hypothetical protein
VVPQALLSYLKLYEVRAVAALFTTAATLRQLDIFVVDKIVEEDLRLLFANALESITLPDGMIQSRSPAVHDAFTILEDLCVLGNSEHMRYLQLEYFHMIFAVCLIEIVLTNYHNPSARGVSLSAHIHTCCPPIAVISKAS